MPIQNDPPVLELEDLRVDLGKRHVLHGLSAVVGGRAIGLLGPNGAGKTTLLHTLLGFHRPVSGHAWVLGRGVTPGAGARAASGAPVSTLRALGETTPPRSLSTAPASLHAGSSPPRPPAAPSGTLPTSPRVARRWWSRWLEREDAEACRQTRGLIGYMPEQDSFIGGMTGIRFVRMMGELSGLPPAVALERAHEALFHVGLGEARYRAIETYSTGMKQCIKLAQALVHGPRLLLLDEPTNGLDPAARKRMLELIREVCDRGGVRIILSSHLLRDVEECCDQVLILKEGQVVRHCDLEAERRANRKFIELQVRGNSDAFSRGLAALDCTVARTGADRYKLVLNDGQEIDEVYHIAHRHDVQLRRLDFRRESLQDIFLKAMEGAHGGP